MDKSKNWIDISLEDVADLTVGFVGKTTNHYVNNGIRFLRSQNVEPFRINLADERFIDEPFHRSIKKSQLEAGDVVIVRTGNPGASAVIPEKNEEWNCSDLVIIKPDHTRINSTFLAAFLNLSYGVISSNLVGAVQQHFNVGAAKKLRLKLPSLKEQNIIASYIDSLNEKITINEKINQNLAEQIKTLCNAWLIDYEPFGGKCPDNWETTQLSSFAEFTSGYSYKGNELQPSSVAMATIKNFDRNGGFKLDGYKEIVPSSKLKAEHHAELFDTLVAHTDLTQNADVIGNAEPILSLSGYDDIVYSMDLVKVTPITPFISKFLIAAILQTQSFKAHCLGYVNGTTVLHMSKKALPEYSLILPSDLTILKPLDEAVASMYQQMATQIDESMKLQKLRDTLLPKLMSGELDVSDIEL